MTTGWGAPRLAYEFCAAVADRDAAAADAIWKGLRTRNEAADLVLALAAQARYAASWTPASADAVRAAQLIDLLAALRDGCCEQIRDYAARALSGRGCNRRPPRRCKSCYRAAADALAEIRLATAAANGLSRQMMAVVSRRQAGPHGGSLGTTEDPQPCSVTIRPS